MIVYDRRGTGASDKPGPPYTTARDSRDLAGMFDSLGLNGVVLLGQNASADVLAAGFRDAAASGTCRGFAVGRTIFQEPARRWLAGTVDDAALKQMIRANFEGLIDAWQDARRKKS